MTTPALIRLIAVTLLAVCLGFLTVLLLPFVFLVWYDAWWRRHEVEAHLSAAMPSPAEAGDGEKEEHPFFVQWAQAEAERARVDQAVDTIAHILVEAKMYAYLKELEQKFQESWKDD
jgi:hypothetical protein